MKRFVTRAGRRVVAVVLAVVVAATAFGASPASAHAALVSSDPAPSAVLETAPEVIRLEFSEPVSPAADAVSIFDATGARIEGGAVSTGESSSEIVLTDVPSLDDGVHVVAWRVVSSDGHLVQGAFTFTIGAGDTTGVDIGELVGGVLAGRPSATGVDTALVVVRWASFLAVVVALGALAFSISPQVDRRRLSSTVLLSMVSLTVSTIAHFTIQGVYLTASGWSSLVDADAWGDVLDTRLGVGLVLRLALIALLVALVLVVPHDDEGARRRMSASWWQSTAALAAVATILTFSMGGHPSAVPLAGLAVAIDVAHLGAVALWLGGLVATWIGGRGRVEVIEHLSRVATVAAPIAVATGVWQTWRIGGGWGNLADTTWGRGMIVKVTVVAVLVGLGAVARLVVRRGFGTESGPAPIGRLLATEIVVAFAVLGVSAYVVGESPVAARPSAVYSTTLAQGSVIVDLTVTPGTVGNNEIHVVVSPPGGTLQRVESLEMRATPPGDGAIPLTVAITDAGPNHFVGRVAFTEVGEWTLEIVVRPDASTSVRLSDVFFLDDL